MHVSGLAYVSAVACRGQKKCPNPPEAGVTGGCELPYMGVRNSEEPDTWFTEDYFYSYTQNLLCTFLFQSQQQLSSNEAS